MDGIRRACLLSLTLALCGLTDAQSYWMCTYQDGMFNTKTLTCYDGCCETDCCKTNAQSHSYTIMAYGLAGGSFVIFALAIACCMCARNKRRAAETRSNIRVTLSDQSDLGTSPWLSSLGLPQRTGDSRTGRIYSNRYNRQNNTEDTSRGPSSNEMTRIENGTEPPSYDNACAEQNVTNSRTVSELNVPRETITRNYEETALPSYEDITRGVLNTNPMHSGYNQGEANK